MDALENQLKEARFLAEEADKKYDEVQIITNLRNLLIADASCSSSTNTLINNNNNNNEANQSLNTNNNNDTTNNDNDKTNKESSLVNDVIVAPPTATPTPDSLQQT